MEFRILGPLEVRREGARLALGGAKQRALLAVLLLNANEVVPTERLVEALWDEPPEKSAKAVQVYVSRLRKALGGRLPLSRPPGYVLELESEQLDLARFQRLLEAARKDPARAAERLREALALWRGPALAEFSGEPFARVERLRLDELRLAALEERIDADLALGREAALVGELEALVAAHPLRERVRGQLMLALYRCGRQAEALAAYREGRRALVDELGIEPGRALQQLEQAILRQDSELDPTQPQPERAPPAELSPAAAAVREERKVVSILFADLADFVARGDGLDPEDLRSILAPYHSLLRAELERFGGTVEKFIGDAVMAVFGAPAAREDDAERAVRAGLAVLGAIDRLNHERQLGLAIRAAVNTGEVVVAVGAHAGKGEGIVTGDVVNVASRLQQLAPVGGLVVGEATYLATRDAITYEQLEPAVVRGKPEVLPIWRARAARHPPGEHTEPPVSAPFIGRDEELALLEQTFRRAVREGDVQLVTVTGEPGVGKSRLVTELQAAVTERRSVKWLRGRCLPYGEGVTFWALGDIVKALAGILESDGPEQASEKLAAAVEEAVEEPSDREWVQSKLAPLVGAGAAEPAAVERTESFTAWRRFLEALASSAPLVLLFEDLHWADDALLEFIEHLVDRSTDVPLLVVATARPAVYERRPAWGGGKRNSTTVSLSPLTVDETARLLSALLGQATLPAKTQADLLERAGGNPLYAVEFVRMLTDRRLLEGRARIPAEAEIPVPETVQALIAGRLDTLSAERKSLLQDAAVIGNVFWVGALAFSSQRDEREVEEELHDLARRQLVRRSRTSSVEDEAQYSFWHMLVRDVAYRQIPRAARAAKHRAAAEWIERIAGERAGDYGELLAHHYGQALELARSAGQETTHLAERARSALTGAADRAFALSAFDAAARFYSAALELWPEDDPERGRLLFRCGRATWSAVGGGLELVAQAREQFEAAGDLEAAAEAETFLGFVLWMRGERDAAYEHADGGIRLLEHEPGSPAKAYALSVRARIGVFGGEARSIELGRQALSLAEQLGLDELRAQTLATLGLARLTSGDTGGLSDLEQSLELALAINAPLEISRGYNNIATVYRQLGQLAHAWELVSEAWAVCERFGLPAQLHFVGSNEAVIAYLRGDWVKAEGVAEDFIVRTEAGAPHYHSVWRWVRGKIRLARGDSAGALDDAAREVELARRSPFPQHLGAALTLGARVLLSEGQPQRAAELAREFLGLPVLQQAAFTPGSGMAVLDLAWTLIELGRGSELLGLERMQAVNAWVGPALAVASGDFARAADLLADMGAASEEAYARLRAAETLASAGRRTEADAQLQRALAFHRSVGAMRYIHEGESQLAALGLGHDGASNGA